MVSDKDVTRGEQEVLFSTENYRELGSSGDAFKDAALLLKQSGLTELVTSEDLGDGFSVADKDTLIGAEMLVLAAMVRTGDLGQYVVVRAVTKDGRKVVVVDGGTGLKDQLVDYMERNKGEYPRHWKHGLRVSRYEAHVNASGETVPAGETYYLDTSA